MGFFRLLGLDGKRDTRSGYEKAGRKADMTNTGAADFEKKDRG